MCRWPWSDRSWLFLALVAGSVLPAAAQEFEVEVKEGEGGGKLVLLAEKREEKPVYWIGVGLEPADESGTGAAVNEVFPNSPAAKAGIKTKDVIVAVGKKPVGSLEELSKFVAESGGGVLVLEVLRDGKKQPIPVKPEPRPAASGGGLVLGVAEAERGSRGGAPAARDRVIELREPLAGGGVVQWKALAAPAGAMMPAAGGGLPDDMDVKIEKRGSKPARITVTQGDKQWRTTEKELEMLPGPARAYAMRVLGRPMMGMPGASMPGAMPRPVAPQGEGQHFELRLNPQGGIEGVNPPRFRIEIPEGGKPNPAPNPKPEPKSTEAKPDARVQREEIERLRSAVEALRKALEAREREREKK